MQADSTERTQSSGPTSVDARFDQIAQGLKAAFSDIQRLQSQEGVASVLSALAPLRSFGSRLWAKTFGFARKHPVETTVAIVAVGFLVAQLMKPRMQKIDSDRQY